MRSRASLPMLALAAFLGASTLWAQAQGRVSGTVLDENNEPIEGVMVTLAMQDSDITLETQTNKKGKFTLTVVDATRDYVLRLEKEGHRPSSEPVDVVVGTAIRKTWVLPSVAAAPAESAAGSGVDLTGKITSESRDAINAYNSGRRAYEEGDIAGAIAQFELATELDPGLVKVLEALVQLQLADGGVQGAIATAGKLLAVEPANPIGLAALYDALVAAGRQAEALPHLDALLAVDRSPLTAVRQYNAGLHLMREGDSAGAMDRLKLAVEIDPALEPAHALLGSIYLEQKDYQQALVHADALVAADPASVKGLALQVDAYRGLGEQEKAAAAQAALRDADPQLVASTYYKEGVEHFEGGRVQQALASLRAAIEADPEHARAHYQLGLALVSAGDNASAREHLERFVALAPDDPEAGSARDMLGYLK